MKKIVLLAAVLILSACSIYRPTLQQGNVLKKEQIDHQLKKGMSRSEVINLLGQPVLQDTTNPDQLVYIETIEPANGKMTTHKLELTFSKADALIKIVPPLSVPEDQKPLERVVPKKHPRELNWKEEHFKKGVKRE